MCGLLNCTIANDLEKHFPVISDTINGFIVCVSKIQHIHRVPKKGTDSILAVTLTNLENF